MHTRMRGCLAMALAALSLLGLAAGCGQDQKKDSGPVDAGIDDGGPPVNAGRLGAALASAAAGGTPAPSANAGAGAAQGGPPESGVFAPGAAEVALPKATPYKLELLGDGAEPRALLAPKIDPKAEQKSAVVIGLRGANLPSIDMALSFKVDKPKKDAKADADKPAPAGTTVIAKVISAVPASMSLGGPAKELTELFGKLKGGVIRYQLSPSNTVGDMTFELPKDAEPALVQVLESLGEAISALATPTPDKPVGVGAYWMVTDRLLWPGAKIPLLRYRVFKITSVEPNGAVTLSVDTRQYAEDSTVKLPQGPQEVSATIDGLDSAGKGTLVWDPAALAPRQGELNQRLVARVVPPGAPPGSPQRLAIQSELAVRFQPPEPAKTP